MTSAQGWIILIFLILGLFVMRFDQIYSEVARVEVKENMEPIDDSNTAKDLLTQKKIDAQIKELEQTDINFYDQIESGVISQEMDDGPLGKELRRFLRCRVVPTGAEMTNLIDLETVKAGSIASRSECFEACDADIRCKQAVHRQSKGTSTCFPMSAPSKDTPVFDGDGDEFQTLRCDQGTLTDGSVVGDMQTVYSGYIKKRKLQEDAVKDSVKKIEARLRMEDRKKLVTKYKTDRDDVLKKVKELEGETEAELQALNELDREDSSLDGEISAGKRKLSSQSSHMWMWTIVSLLAVGGTWWAVVRLIK
jgi:hypothetical protein